MNSKIYTTLSQRKSLVFSLLIAFFFFAPGTSFAGTYNWTCVVVGPTYVDTSGSPICDSSTLAHKHSFPGSGNGYYGCTCNYNPGSSCNLPWGGSLTADGSVTAYQSSSVPSGSSCVSQTRTCTSGALSGSYTNSYCSPQFNITASAGTGGTISPSGTAAFTAGQSAITASNYNPGYPDIASWIYYYWTAGTTVWGPAITSADIYWNRTSGWCIFSPSPAPNPTSASVGFRAYASGATQAGHSCSGSYIDYSVSSYDIRDSNNPYQAPTPAVAGQPYIAASSQAYTITPSSGYNIASVVVDGVNQGAIGSYTFSNIQANHTIPATFAANPINGTCSATHYSCAVGTSASNAENSPNWTWMCNGSNGGTNASCSQPIPTPTNQTSSCSASGTSATVSWTLPSPYTLSYFRITDNTAGTNPAVWIPENKTDTGPSTSFATTPGHSYTSWIHTRLPSGAYSSEVYTSFVCAASCPLPWGGTILSGASATAYQSSSVTYPATCTSQSRTCTNGSLSGTYTNQTCATAPATATLSISPTSIAYNGRPTLTWGSTGATSCTAGGPWSNSGTLSGSGLTNPLTSNTTFTFQCTGPGGTSALQSVTVTVGAPASCTSTTISNCSLTGVSSGSSSTGSCVSGYSGTCTYSCSNGTWSQTTNTCVATPTASLNVTSPVSGIVNSGGKVVLTWNSTNSDSCTFADIGTVAASGTRTVGPLTPAGSPYTYDVFCSKGSVKSSHAMATVTVVTPVLSLSSSPNRVQKDSPTTLSWSATNVSSCTITKNGSLPPWKNLSGASLISSSPDTTVTTQTTYVLSCMDVNGTTYATTVTTIVNVAPWFEEF